MISAVRCERALRVPLKDTGARPPSERTKLMALRVAVSDAELVEPTWQALSLAV